MSKLTVKQVRRMMANPFYCMKVNESLCQEHETLISEEDWIKASENSIKESGAKVFLENLLENLKGNFEVE